MDARRCLPVCSDPRSSTTLAAHAAMSDSDDPDGLELPPAVLLFMRKNVKPWMEAKPAERVQLEAAAAQKCADALGDDVEISEEFLEVGATATAGGIC